MPHVDVRGIQEPSLAQAISGYISVPQHSLYQRTADRMRRMRRGDSITVETAGSVAAICVFVRHGRMHTGRPFKCEAMPDAKTVRIMLG